MGNVYLYRVLQKFVFHFPVPRAAMVTHPVDRGITQNLSRTDHNIKRGRDGDVQNRHIDLRGKKCQFGRCVVS